MDKFERSLKLNTGYVILIISLFYSVSVHAELKPRERNILAKKADEIGLDKIISTGGNLISLPGYRDREFWQMLPDAIQKEYVKRAERYLNYNWPAVKATDYLEFIRSGDRRQEVYAACSNALNSLVMGELAEGKGRFMDQIVNAVWYFSEQTWWGWSAHLGPQKAGAGLPDINDPFVDLGVGEITSDLSWTWYMFHKEFDSIHPLISQRLKQEIMNKAIIPYSTRDDFWYMGFAGGRPNNWNPWVNFNMLTSCLLIEDDPGRKAAEVGKIIKSLDKFLNGYSDDGGCDEGPSYWGAAGALLYESLELLMDATGGKFDLFGDQLIRNIGSYFYKVNIHAPYFINFADADATTTGDASAVYRYGKAINDTTMRQFGAYLARLSAFGEHAPEGKICDQIRSLAIRDEIRNASAKEALVGDFWLPDTEIAGARDKEGSYEGFFFGAKGGFNDESHNHNDVGSCVLYFNGKPCLIDLGREEYNAKTFSPQRYEIWTMQSGFHNLPVINGTEQKDGEMYRAKNSSFSAGVRSATFSTDIAGAYPEGARVKSWKRSYTLNRGRNFMISDNYELSEATANTTSSNLITYCKVSELKPGLLRFEGDGFTLDMTYNSKTIRPEITFIEVKDRALKQYWPGGVTRIRMIYLNPGIRGENTFTFRPVKTAATINQQLLPGNVSPVSRKPFLHEITGPGRERTVAYLDSLMMVVFDFNDGPMKEPDPFHSHPHEQISYIAEGEIIFYLGKEEYHLTGGDMITIPAGVPHCIKTLTSHVRAVDSFYPLRKDFLKTK